MKRFIHNLAHNLTSQSLE